MQAQCPSCEAIFRVTYRQLSMAEGLVRCGACAMVFNGREHLRTLGSGTPYPAADRPLERAAWLAQRLRVEDRDEASPAHTGPAPDAPASPEPLDPEPIDSEPAEEEAFSEMALSGERPGGSARSAWATAAWSLGILGLIAALAGQYVYTERQALARYPAIGGYLARACERLGCELAPPREPSRIEVVKRNVYSHPNVAGALVIAARIANDAPFAQPYPLLQVAFTDLQGEILALGRFEPSAYLPANASADAPMQPGIPVSASLEVADPGSEALAFELSFY